MRLEKAEQIRGVLRSAGRSAANLLFPPVCMICGADVRDPHSLCLACWRETALISGPACDGCARPVDFAVESTFGIRCENCADHAYPWRKVRAAALYDGGARKLVLALKHGDRPDLAPALARWMVRAARDALGEADAVMPVPLYWTRRLQRRFNQSAELSRSIARFTGCEHLAGTLRRVRPTESQRGKNIAERRRNLEGAFKLPSDAAARIAGRRIVLVDDVMTTGATLAAAAEATLRAGARNVDAAVFARA